MNPKVYGLLGMAVRARKVNSGDAVIEDIRKKKAKLIVICEDASENTIKKITDKCRYYGIEYVYAGHSDDLNHAMGTYNRKAVSIIDAGFAKSIKACLKG